MIFKNGLTAKSLKVALALAVLRLGPGLGFGRRAGALEARPYPVQEAWPIGFGSGQIGPVEWLAAPGQVRLLGEEKTAVDGFDLQEMGRRVLLQNLGTLIPDRMGYRPVQWFQALECPTLSAHREYSEVAEQAGRLGTALCLLRQAFGFKEGIEKEEGMLRVTAHHIKFGLPSQPKPDVYEKFSKSETPEIKDEADLPYFVDFGFAVPLVLETWILRYEMTQEAGLRKLIEECIASLRSNAVEDPATGYRYYPTRGVELDRAGKAQWGGAYPYAGAGCLVPLAHWAQLRGDVDLMAFLYSVADGVVAGVGMPLESEPLKFNRVRWDGSFEMDVSHSKWAWPGGIIPKIANPVLAQTLDAAETESQVHWGQAHVLSSTTGWWGVAYAGMVTGEARYLDWAKRAYGRLMSIASDSGWFQQHLPWPWPGLKDPRQNSETCITADMMDMAAFFAQAGDSDYWDHVERGVRNYLAVMQFRVTPQFEAYYRQVNRAPTGTEVGSVPASREPKLNHTDAEVEAGLKELRQKLDGGVVATCMLNDNVIGLEEDPKVLGCMGCCTWSGARGIGRAGVSVVTLQKGGTYVNLSISHETPQIKVVSFLPACGRVTAVVKQPGRFYLRPPAWTPRQKVGSWRNAKPVTVSWEGRYVRFDDAAQGEELTITYPVPHFLQRVTIAGRKMADRFTLEWLGNTVVGVDPPGQRVPLYYDRQNILAAAGLKSLLRRN